LATPIGILAGHTGGCASRIDSGPRAYLKRFGVDPGNLELFSNGNSYLCNNANSAPETNNSCQTAAKDLRLQPDSNHRLPMRKFASGFIIRTPQAVVHQLVQEMAHLSRETFRVLFLDTRNRLLADETLWEGTINHVQIYPREVVRRAIDIGATALIAVHNHPHGNPVPSRNDVTITNRLGQACSIIEVKLHDHLIVGKEGWFSMAAAGLLA
jgi:DNA repair protein RadC